MDMYRLHTMHTSSPIGDDAIEAWARYMLIEEKRTRGCTRLTSGDVGELVWRSTATPKRGRRDVQVKGRAHANLRALHLRVREQ